MYFQRRKTAPGLHANRVFIRHIDHRLLIVSYAAGKTLITALDGKDATTPVATFSGALAFDGRGWNMKLLEQLLDDCIGRVCVVCGQNLSGGKLYCSAGCKQASYRARKG